MDKEKFASKNLFWSLLNLILLVILIFGIKVVIFGVPSVSPPRTITVSAEGKAVVAPDIAQISFSVLTEGKDPAVIQAENTGKMNTAIDFVKGQGIDSKDIKTANYNLYPRYEFGPPTSHFPREQKIIGYTLTQTVFVKVRDLNKVGTILAGLPEKGINQIESTSFSVEDPDKYLNEVRAEAFAKALEKAKTMAKQNDVRIRRVVNFSEGFGGPVPYFLKAESAFGRGGDAAPAPTPTIEPGSEEVTVNVSVTYEIR